MSTAGLTVLYTANLAGRLDMLPRLFAFIRRARAAASGPTTLLDLGHSCDPAQPICAATEGRAALIVLDAMGYDAVCLDDADCAMMSAAAVQKLLDAVSFAVCGSDTQRGLPGEGVWQAGAWRLVCHAGGAAPSSTGDLVIRPLTAGTGARLDVEAQTLWLARPRGEAVLGIAEVQFDSERRPEAVTWRLESMPADVRADATVAATVAFVRDEARLYQKMQQKGGANAAG